MTTNWKRFLSLSTALLTAHTSLHAQETTVANDEIIELDSFIVEGEKSGRTLLDTYNGIEIHTSEQIDDRALLTMGDIFLHTAGATSGSIRGVSSTGIGGAGFDFNTTVTNLVDGVVQPRWNSGFEGSNLWDVSHVEILMGGQSSNLGKSSLAGAVVVNSNDPVFYRESAAELRLADNNGQAFFALYNQPFSESVSLRLSGGHEENDGFNYNATLDRAEDFFETTWGRAKLLIAPKENESFRSLTTFYYSEVEKGDSFVDGANPYDRVIYSNVASMWSNDTRSITEDLDFEINSNLSVNAILTYSDFEYHRLNDEERTAEGGENHRFRDEFTDQFTSELRLNYSDQTQKAHVGIYSSNSKYDEVGGGILNVVPFIRPLFGAQAPLLDVFFPDGIISNLGDSKLADVKTNALFGEYERHLSDDWSIRLGLRAEKEKIDYESGSDRFFITDVSTSPFAGPLQALVEKGNEVEDTDYTVYLPSLALTRHLSERSNITLLYKEDYRSGGVDIDLANLSTNQFDPEYTATFELAYRAATESGIVFTANAYHTNWKDQQVGVDGTIPGLTITRNAGKSELQGIELAIEYAASETLDIYANAAYNKTKFIDFVDNNNDYSGNRFGGAPEFTTAIGATKSFAENWTVDGNLTYQDESYRDAANTATLDGFALANVSLRYQAENWNVRLYVKNLFDREYITSSTAIQNIVRVGNPRLIGGSATIRF